ncbi:MAG: methyltransferase [Bacteroidetes bacterium]|nr:methyltransferase [Bacteroidota bacterium]
MSQFHFKKFSLHHQHSSMKVGTDAVLLGAWCKVEVGEAILEVGSGCGVISCMLAQRGANAIGLEIHQDSVLESIENAKALPFDNKPVFIGVDFFDWSTSEKFEGIVSNPPFFIQSLNAPNETRNQARHLNAKWIKKFWRKAFDLSRQVSIIIPYIDSQKWIALAHHVGFAVTRSCEVYSFEKDESPIRLLLEFQSNGKKATSESKLVLYADDKSRTVEYTKLCEDYYL